MEALGCFDNIMQDFCGGFLVLFGWGFLGFFSLFNFFKFFFPQMQKNVINSMFNFTNT